MREGDNYNIPSNNRELQPSLNIHLHLYNYNIPSNNRELQHARHCKAGLQDYNIPSNNRELQLILMQNCNSIYYNIPSNNRELQQNENRTSIRVIITYQVITGNYSNFGTAANNFAL